MATPVKGMSAKGKPPSTVAATTPGSRSSSRARSIAVLSGDCQVVTIDWFGAISGSLTWAIVGVISPSIVATRICSARAPVSGVSMCGYSL